MAAINSPLSRVIAPLVLAAAAVLCPATGAAAQVGTNSSTLGVTVVNNPALNPSGDDFKAGFWVVTTLNYSISCGNKGKCALRIQSTGALSGPVLTTQVQYSFDGAAFVAVTSSPTLLGALVNVNATKSGTIVVRYQLGWAPVSPYTPAGSYSLPIQLTLQQSQ